MFRKWNKNTINSLYNLPLFNLVNKAFNIQQQYFPDFKMEFCTLLNVKSGGCSEDCAYCSQSAHYNTGVKSEGLLDIDVVVRKARLAKKRGVKRFCMGAAWSYPPQTNFRQVLEMISRVKAIGIETCVTLGKVSRNEAIRLKEAGLDFYNHNLNTAPHYYKKIVTTHSFKDRINTVKNLKSAGLKICCGGIIGMGESRQDRINFLLQLSLLPAPPDSIPINRFIPMKGTPLGIIHKFDNFEFIKTIAITRILFPKTTIRLAAGRKEMTPEMQAWCFMAGANSIFYGDFLLTAPNPECKEDLKLLKKLGLRIARQYECI